MSTTGRENHSFPRIFKGRRGRTGQYMKCTALPRVRPYLRIIRFQGYSTLKRKENSSQGPRRRLRVQLRCRKNYPRPGSGMLTRFPFDRQRIEVRVLKRSFPIS
jgi:hypothetical protein